MHPVGGYFDFSMQGTLGNLVPPDAIW